MKNFKSFVILSAFACLSTITLAEGAKGYNVMASPIYAQRIILSDLSAGKVLIYFSRHLDCDTCITKTFYLQGRDFYLKYAAPRKTEQGKIFASFRILPQCDYDIQLSFIIKPSGEFILPTGKYISIPDSRNAPNCNPPVPMTVSNGEDITYISWG